ncbi:MAG: hypothetical protein QOK47_1683 [Actinomycetota bacterium]|nr:hypothetical protein [Actinomycetota bacterium]
MKEVRVLQVLGRSAGGIGRHVAQVVSHLDGKDGLTLDVAAPPDLEVPMPKAVIELDIPDGLSSGHVVTARRLKRLIGSGGYTVVHAHGLRAGMDASLAARAAGVRAIVTLHNLIRPETSGPLRSVLFRRAESVVIALASHVFAVSQEMADQLTSRWVGRRKVETLYIGASAPAVSRDGAEVRRELGVAENDLLVVTVARLARQKALDVLLDAVALLPGVKLAIVGDGPLRTELEQHAATVGVAERVRFVGRKEEVGDYIAAADVFALSSSWEARALAAQEAILLKVPVVTTDVGGMSEIVTDGVSGRLVPAGDPAAFARALADVLGDRDKARRWGEAAAHQLDAGFSTEAMLKRLSDEYRKDGDD